MVPAGVALYAAIDTITGAGQAPLPPLWHLLLVVLSTVAAVTALTAIPPASVAATPWLKPSRRLRSGRTTRIMDRRRVRRPAG